MKPYVLTLRGFGPFEDETTVDFTRFDNSLFLITGKTGAGKSTLFDAMMYALFGETSGKERAPKDMRTQNLDKKINTQISLEFEHNGRTYLVKRTISGQNSRKEDAMFRNYDGSLVENSTAVTTAIKNLLGIEAKQFRMIAMLPQGKFRELLTAKSETKSEILKKLFDTRIYELFQNKLKARDSQFKEEREAFERDIVTQIKYLKTPEDDPAYAWLSGFIKEPAVNGSMLDALFTDLRRLADEDEKRIEKIGEETENLNRELKRISEEKGKAEDGNKLLEQAAASRRHLEDLLPREEYYRDKDIRAKRARAAESVAIAETAYLNAEKTRAGLEKTIADNTKIIDETKTVIQNIEADINARENNPETAADRKKQELLILSLENYQRLAAIESEQKTLEAAITESMEEAASIDTEISTIQDEIRFAEEKKRTLEPVDLMLNETKNQLQSIRDKQQTLEELETIAEDIGRLETSLQTSQQECRIAKETYQIRHSSAESLHQEYLDGQAGILADTLTDDTPCPVCGSRTHPSPAKHAGSIPDRATVAAAQKAADDAREIWTKKTTDAAECRAKRTAREEEFRKNAGTFVAVAGSIDEICNLLSTYTKNLQEDEKRLGLEEERLKKQTSEKQKVAEILPKLRADLETKQMEKAKAEQTYSTDVGQLKEREKTIADLRKKLPYPVRKDAETAIADLEKKLEQGEKEILALRTSLDDSKKIHNQADGVLRDALSRLDSARSAETETYTAYQHARETNGFSTAEEYRNALLDAQEIADMEKDVRSFFTDLETAKAVCRQAEENSKGRKPVELDALIEQQRILGDELNRLHTASSAYMSRRDNNKRIADGIAERLREEKSRSELYTAVHKLAETANGSINKQDKIDLERYIQAVYFSEILRFANNKFLTMSNNRYQLIRPESATTQQHGLELAVIDRFTGQTRNITTLSGGESFLAALALALGLSEMIQHLSGGIAIDALFVDEGFDTLDTEALQDVLKVLWELTTGNRVVGIISHRGELRDQLDRKIIVTKLGNGRSTLRPEY